MSRDDADMLIALLLDNQPLRQGFRHAMEGEILFQQNAVDYMLGGGDAGSLSLTGNSLPLEGLAMRLTARNSGIIMIKAMKPLLIHADHDRLSDVLDDESEALFIKIEEEPFSNLMASILLPSLNRATDAHYRVRDQRGRAAVALAANLYRHDHGQLPPTLEVPVPEYLPAVPVDTMTEDGFVQYDPDRGIAWTVGEDGIDHGGVSQDERQREMPKRFVQEAESGRV